MTKRAPRARSRTPQPLWIALLAAILVACGANPASQGPTAVPTAAPTVNLTPPPGSLTPAAEIEFLVEAMAANVRVGNRADYLKLIDLSDPAFSLEHSRLADEWAGLHPAPDYRLTVADLDVEGDAATGDLTANWTNYLGEPREATWSGTLSSGRGGPRSVFAITVSVRRMASARSTPA